jgi:hypothetical protein
MQLAVMEPANRDDELVAHAASECTRLCKREVMRIRRNAAAHEARLSHHELPVILIAQANRFAQSTDRGAARPLPPDGRSLLAAAGMRPGD